MMGRGVVAAAVAAVVAATVLPGPSVQAGMVSNQRADACSDVQLVFARGSGQGLNDKQFVRFRDQLVERLDGSGATIDVHELGSGGYSHQYPAVPVANVWDGNALGGKVTGGMAGDYGNSVWEGVFEYTELMVDLYQRCPTTKVVAAGFSQGAQVVGQAYSAWGSDPAANNIRSMVAFNALFGDPKLYLPEGEGLDFWKFEPPACRGEDHSPWRRVIAECTVDDGSLGARKPYLPAGWEQRTGLWCALDDFVCGASENPTSTENHTYYEEGGDIDAGAREAAERLRDLLPEKVADKIDVGWNIIGTGTTGLDVMFVLDSTGSMSDQLEAAKEYASQMGDVITALRGRVALVEYRDAGDEFTSRLLTPLTDDLEQFRAALAPIRADGGGDTPEALLSALMTGFNGLEWRPGATKAAVVLTDADYHDPDLVTGVTTAEVAARALEIDPVNVYPVTSSYSPQLEALAEATSGRVIRDDGDTVAALEEALTTIEQRPVVLLALSEYVSRPGVPVTFDASASYATQGYVVSYEWDFDGDGAFESTTTVPTVQHVYDDVFEGQMQVRVTDSEGGFANHSVPVRILTPAQAEERFSRPGAPGRVTVKSLTKKHTSVKVAWTAGSGDVTAYEIKVGDVVLGRTAASRRDITLTKLARNLPSSVTVTSVGKNGRGVGRTATLKSVTRTKAKAPRKLRAGKRARLRVRVVNQALNEVRGHGLTRKELGRVKVVVKRVGKGARPVRRTVRLTPTASGQVRVRTPRLAAGRYRVTVTYSGSSLFFASKATRRIRVR